MIKTVYKEKLPKGYSYPVGAEIISAALSEVPQYEEIEICFWRKDQPYASLCLYNQKITEGGSISILKVWYSSALIIVIGQLELVLYLVPLKKTHQKKSFHKFFPSCVNDC
jgi:hypothetical protein